MYVSSPNGLPPNPPTRLLRPKSRWRFFWMFLPVVLVIYFIGYQVFWPEYQRKQIIKNGLRAEGVILDADPTGSTYNSQPEVRLQLRVIPQNGEAYAAETVMVVNPIYAPEFQPGKRVKVRYDREDRSKVAVEETENGQR